MKRILLLITTLVSLGFGSKAQNVNIPDAGLKQVLADHGVSVTGAGIGIIDVNTDGEIQLSEALAYTGKIQIGIGGPTIWDHTGVEAFINATEFYLQNTQGVTLDLSLNTALTYLYVQSNALTTLTLPVGSTSLQDLTILCNNIPSTIDVSAYINLTDLKIRYSSATILDLSSLVNLIDLDCQQNQLTTLVLPNTSTLLNVDCSQNNLSMLDLSQSLGLEIFQCYMNQFTSLDVSILPLLNLLVCLDNNLIDLNVANGNNSNFIGFNALTNPNLTCIQVDDAAYSTTNWTNTDATASFSENCGVGINEIISSEVNIYPNPATSKITIDSDEIIQEVLIFDIFGSLVQTENTKTFTIENLASGIYQISVKTKSAIIKSRFIKGNNLFL